MIDIDATFLPVGRMRLVSRVTRLDDATISGEVDLQDHWVFADHFPGDPIFPGSLIVEAAGQLVAIWAWAQGQRGHPRLVKTNASFREPVVPDAGAIELRAELRARRHLTFAEVSVWTGDVRVASVGVTLAVLPHA